MKQSCKFIFILKYVMKSFSLCKILIRNCYENFSVFLTYFIFQIMFSMFNKLLMCVCLADLSFLVFNLAVCPNILMVKYFYFLKTYNYLPVTFINVFRKRKSTQLLCTICWSASFTSVCLSQYSSQLAALLRGTRLFFNKYFKKKFKYQIVL